MVTNALRPVWLSLTCTVQAPICSSLCYNKHHPALSVPTPGSRNCVRCWYVVLGWIIDIALAN